MAMAMAVAAKGPKGGSKEGSPRERRVAVALIMSTSHLLTEEPVFLLVASRKHSAEGRFVLPKGGIEAGEDAATAGLREAWEEAGLIEGSAMHVDHIVLLLDEKPHDRSPSKDPTKADFVACTSYSFELYTCGSKDSALAEDWPEKAERASRKWVQGWAALEAEVNWGRRGPIFLQALKLAKARTS